MAIRDFPDSYPDACEGCYTIDNCIFKYMIFDNGNCQCHNCLIKMKCIQGCKGTSDEYLICLNKQLQGKIDNDI